MAKSYILKGEKTIKEYMSEKERALAAIGARADAMQKREEMMKASDKYFSESVEIIADITDRINMIDDVDHATVERIYRKLTASHDMSSMPPKQRAKMVHAAILEDRENRKKINRKRGTSVSAEKAESKKKNAEKMLEGLKNNNVSSLDDALSAPA